MSGEMARAEVSTQAAAPGFRVDLFEQATKSCALRTPFDGEEVPPRDPTLPSRLVSWSWAEDCRKKHKKVQPPPDAERPLDATVSRPAKAGLWEQFEAYFRPVTLDDVEMLNPKLPFSGSKVDSSMLIPFLGSSEELVNEAQTFDVAVAETSSYLGVGGEEVISNRERSEPHQKERSIHSAEQDIHDVVVQQLASDKELIRQTRGHGIHEVSVQLGDRPFEAYEAARSSGIVSAQCAEKEGASLNWLLSAKGRFVLTSERPNKKRKLLGVDAGLEQLVLLPSLGPEVSSYCNVCCLGESSMESNRIVSCSRCKVSVHPKCYGLHAVPDGQWLCAWCTYLESSGCSPSKDAGGTQSMPCVLCPKEKGALKPVKVEPAQNAGAAHLKFVHLFCSLWAPEIFVEDMESMEPITNLENVQENRMKLTCSICKIKHGACVRCSHGTCRTPFHPICARESNHQMEIWGKSGHPNVELRAFCLKHSAAGLINPVKNNNNASEQSQIITGNVPKLRFTRKNKDKFMNCEAGTTQQAALPLMVKNTNAQPLQSFKTDTVCPSVVGDHMRSSDDIAAVLRKLIDSGNVNVGDIASEVGISSESLEAALVGETTTFSHGLKLKIIKWLQTYEHIHADQGSAKGTSVVGQDYKPDVSNAIQTVDVKKLMVPDDDRGALVDVSGSAVIEPSLTRSKFNNKVLEDKNTTCATGATILQNGNSNTLECSPADESELSSIGRKNVSKEEHGKLILNTTSGNKEFGTSVDIPNENQGILLGMKSSNVSEADLGSELEERVSSLGHCFAEHDKDKTGMNSVENGVGTSCDCNSNCFHGQLFLNFDDSHSYIHPFIKNKMAHYWDSTLKQDNEASCHRDQQSYPSQEETSVKSSQKFEDTIDTNTTDQVLNARSSKLLEHSPDDEVEGEIVYLQTRLLDNAFVLKHRYETLLANVVHNLSRELDAFSKRKWDLILVNQFLRDVREAKKRGRKEKRHKEAQAVLAAAAVAPSSRNSTMRKDIKEDVVPTNQEGSSKLAAGSSRVSPWISSLPRAKDTSKSSNSKILTENNFWSFHMPISSKENPLYCDVCMRTETVLNRIFVCPRCKAAVHIDCYKKLDNSVGPWTCEFCEDISSEAATISDGSGCNGRKSPFAQCVMCHGTSGAFRKTTEGQWVHAFCAEWLLGTKYVRGQDNLVHGTENIEDGKDACCVCLHNVGMCLRCDSGDCHLTFHPTCARNSGFYMNTKGFGTTLQHKAYCGKHSVEQKEVDAQQYGHEELKSMKQMRVELEKLRLLCERIIKREKVKRETALCDHDILAKTKDAVVFSYLASGASSESATTSVNNKSYSGTMQRSDDVTVDSTISGKKTIRFSLNSRDTERNTADSSRTLISFKRKLGERGSVAGKQLPQRPAMASQKLEDGGKKTNDKKGAFQKELVMTSDQACTQNQRLPKGYAYVPRDSLSKDKPWNRNAQAHNPQEPGG